MPDREYPTGANPRLAFNADEADCCTCVGVCDGRADGICRCLPLTQALAAPDREYPAGALEALTPYRNNYAFTNEGEGALRCLAAMSPEDRAALRRFLDPEGHEEAAIVERDEIRRANVTPADAERPLGQSVEYWQDRCLDHATALDRCRSELRIARFDASTATGERDMAVAAAVHDTEATMVKRITSALRSYDAAITPGWAANLIDREFGGGEVRA